MKKSILSIFILLLGVVACSGRVPSPKTTQHLIEKHFNKYGKKYPAAIPFGGHQVTKVEILDTEEIQKRLATIKARVSLENGATTTVQINMLYKAPLGWRTQGWENLDTSASVASPSASTP